MWGPGAQARLGHVSLGAASLCGSFCFPAFSRIDLQVSRFCSHLCRSEAGKYSGFEGRTGWSKGWGKADSEDRMPGRPPKLAPHRGATCFQLSHPVNPLRMSLQILSQDEMACADKAFHNLIFDAVPLRTLGIETVCICCNL